MVWLAGCGLPQWLAGPPKIALYCVPQKDGSLVFDLQAGGTNSIYKIVILSQSTGEALWGLEFDRTPIASADFRTFEYGKTPRVPDDPWLRSVKVYPAKGKPRPIGPLEGFIVIVDYQYDSIAGACANATCLYFDALQGSTAKRKGRIGSHVVIPEPVWEAFK
jgi:hypothetical protein